MNLVILNLKGGLGNQMFQYALAYSISKKNDARLVFDLRFLNDRRGVKKYVLRDFNLDIFGIKPMEATRAELAKVNMLFGSQKFRLYIGKLLDFIGFNVISERTPAYENRVLQNRLRNIYLDGYWQSEKYFSEYKEEIKKIFYINDDNFNEKVKILAEKIRGLKNAVCINVRRSDFIGSKHHDLVNKEYYLNSLNLIREKYQKNLKIFIFSDDIEWCEYNMRNISDDVSIIGHEYAGASFSAYLYLMTQFSIFIIPNSTFAWWGAWLSSAKDKLVIAPKRWSGLDHMDTSDILPESWIKN